MTNESEDGDVVEPKKVTPTQGELWDPVPRAEVTELLKSKPLGDEVRNVVLEEAQQLLAKCAPPGDSTVGDRTGLAVGFVQSGKTLSFTTVAALASDNNIPIVIVITGTSTTLNRQSTDRLTSDLQLTIRQDHKWTHLPSPDGDQLKTVQSFLDVWSDPHAESFERECTLLITVMKQYVHLEKLCDLVECLNFKGATCIVIDDEADQASLNTQAQQGRESTTYSQLLRLRNALPLHTFLQYTATPQAPLLINIIDLLSPQFVQVLTPGPGYIGGREVFLDNNFVVQYIPEGDLPTDENQLEDPPDTLLKALRLFFVGGSAGLVNSGKIGNRSMLVHPSHLTASHETYHLWVREICEGWERLLGEDEEDPDRQELVEDFKVAYDDIAVSTDDLPPFETIVQRLRRDIAATRVELVNATGGKTPEIPWNQAYSWILVGGQAVERGFTVNGLIVTYMPRGIGAGNADTIQQRGRFFGYKQSYLGYCRIYLTARVQAAFESYIRHEESIRKILSDHQNTGQPLQTLKRLFFLNTSLRPTRRQVIGRELSRHRFGGKWEYAKRLHLDTEAIEFNRNVVDDFIAQQASAWHQDKGHADRSDIMTHEVVTLPLRNVYEQLLVPLRHSDPEDSEIHTMLLFLLSEYLEGEGGAQCLVYNMSGGRVRERGTSEVSSQISYLFQGAHPDKRGDIYPGDSKLRHAEFPTVQLHHLRIDAHSHMVANVRLAAMFVPSQMANHVMLQNQ